MSDTAPFIIPVISVEEQLSVQNLNIEKISLFNERIQICSNCERSFEHNSIPYCLEQNISLSAAADKEQCPIGKW